MRTRQNINSRILHVAQKKKLPGEPADVAVVLLELLVRDEQQRLLRCLVVARGCQREPMVPVEVVVVVHVRLGQMPHTTPASIPWQYN